MRMLGGLGRVQPHLFPFFVAASTVGVVVAAALKVALAIAVIGITSSAIFLIMILAAAWRYRRLAQSARTAALAVPETSLPPVTILKPIHNMEAELEQNLESFFLQDYPDYEIIFGARDEQNPALRIAELVRARHPDVRVG